MKASAIIEKVVNNKGCVLIRYREPISKPYEYDVKEPFVGNKRGWVMLDLFTASAMNAVYNALSEDHKSKFDMIPFQKLVDFTWNNVH